MEEEQLLLQEMSGGEQADEKIVPQQMQSLENGGELQQQSLGQQQ